MMIAYKLVKEIHEFETEVADMDRRNEATSDELSIKLLTLTKLVRQLAEAVYQNTPEQ